MLVMLYMVMEIQQPTASMLHHFTHLQKLLKTLALAIQMPSLSHLPAAWIPLFNSWCMVKIRILQLQMPMDFAASKVDKLCRKLKETRNTLPSFRNEDSGAEAEKIPDRVWSIGTFGTSEESSYSRSKNTLDTGSTFQAACGSQ